MSSHALKEVPQPHVPLNIGVVEHESRLHQLVFIIHLGAVQVMDAIGVEQDAGAVFLKDLVFCRGKINLHFVLVTEQPPSTTLMRNPYPSAAPERSSRIFSAA
jgi:hypothetical protein